MITIIVNIDDEMECDPYAYIKEFDIVLPIQFTCLPASQEVKIEISDDVLDMIGEGD